MTKSRGKKRYSFLIPSLPLMHLRIGTCRKRISIHSREGFNTTHSSGAWSACLQTLFSSRFRSTMWYGRNLKVRSQSYSSGGQSMPWDLLFTWPYLWIMTTGFLANTQQSTSNTQLWEWKLVFLLHPTQCPTAISKSRCPNTTIFLLISDVNKITSLKPTIHPKGKKSFPPHFSAGSGNGNIIITSKINRA